MSLSTRYPESNLVVFPSTLTNGSVELLDEAPEMPGDGWDTLKRKYLIRDSAQTTVAAALAAYFPRGSQLAGLNMWVTDAGGVKKSGGFYLVDVTARGILSARGYKISTSAAVQNQSGTNIYTPSLISPGVYGAGVLRPKLEVLESQVTCDVSYLSLGAPRTDLVGRNATPPSAPAVPTSWWDWLADPVYHHPNAWVLMSSDGDGLPGVEHGVVCLITDRYQYVYPYSP